MANKHLLFRAAAREKILHGATTLADAVCVTLGPKSQCVLIDKEWGRPTVGNDGPYKGNFGFDVATGKYTDLAEAGIIDPTKVARVALENAISVAGVLLLTEATLTEIPEPKAEGVHAGGLPEEP